MAETVTVNTNNIIVGNKKVEKGGTLELSKNMKLDKVIIGDVKNGEKRFFVVKENGKEILKTKAAIKEDGTINVTLRPGQKYQFEWKGSLSISTVAGKQTAEEAAAEKAEEEKKAAEAAAANEEEKAEAAPEEAKPTEEVKKDKDEEETQLIDVLDEDAGAAYADADEEESQEAAPSGTSTGIIVWLVILTILVVILTGLVWLFTKTVSKAVNDERLAETIVRIKALEKKVDEMPTRAPAPVKSQEPRVKSSAVPQTQEHADEPVVIQQAPQSIDVSAEPEIQKPVQKPEMPEVETPKKPSWAVNTPGRELRNHNQAQMNDLFSQIDDLQRSFTISPDDTPEEES